jgi:hypothetical protein
VVLVYKYFVLYTFLYTKLSDKISKKISKTYKEQRTQTKKMEFKRKLYTRGSSYETTIPMPILFAIDKKQKHNVIFKFDQEKNRWYIEIQ